MIDATLTWLTICEHWLLLIAPLSLSRTYNQACCRLLTCEWYNSTNWITYSAAFNLRCHFRSGAAWNFAKTDREWGMNPIYCCQIDTGDRAINKSSDYWPRDYEQIFQNDVWFTLTLQIDQWARIQKQGGAPWRWRAKAARWWLRDQK